MERKAQIFCIRHHPFKHVSELLEVLSIAETDPDRVTRDVPVFPKAGEVYVYTWESEAKKDRWRQDKHRWRNNGTKKLPTLIPVFTKYYHVLLTDYGVTTQFQRHAYQPLDVSANKIIIHYSGDDTLSKPVETQKSGAANTMKPLPVPQMPDRILVPGLSARQFPLITNIIQTPPLSLPVKRKLESTSEDIKPPKIPPGIPESQSKQSVKHAFGWLMNLRDVAFELEPFVKSITAAPEFACVMASDEILQEFDRVLDLDCPYSQLLSYTSVYLPSGYFVSTLMFRHLLFEGSPFMPVAHVLHKILFSKSGDGFLSEIVNKIPRLKTVKGVIVVDPKIASGVEKCLNTAQIVYSWSNLRRNAKSWMTNTNEANRSKYMNELATLLESKSEINFDRQLELLKSTWDEAWSDYFSDSLEGDIRIRAGRWRLEELGVYCSYAGVTPALSNPFETVMHSLAAQDPANMEASTIALALNHLHSYFINQVYLTQTGQHSQYTLRKEFSEIILDPEDVIFPKSVLTLDKIVQTSMDQIQNGPPYLDSHSGQAGWGIYPHSIPGDLKTNGASNNDSLSHSQEIDTTKSNGTDSSNISDSSEPEVDQGVVSEVDDDCMKIKEEPMPDDANICNPRQSWSSGN